MKIESFLRWLAIVLFTALAVFVTVPAIAMTRDAILRHMNFYSLTVAAMVVSWFIVIRLLFQDFYVRGQLSGGVKKFYENVLTNPVQRLYKTVVSNARTLNARFILIGFNIVIAFALLSLTNVLDFRALPYFYLLRIPVFNLPNKAVAESSEGTLRSIALLTPDNNPKRYLEVCLKIARDLQQAGARVMLMDLPPNILPLDEHLNLVSELQKTGIVVFGTRDREEPLLPQKRIVYNSLSGKMDFPWAHFTFQVEELSRSPFVQRFVPYGYTDVRTGKPVPDVALEVLRKYSGAPSIENQENMVAVGNYRLPVSDDGYLYSFSPSLGMQYAAFFRLDEVAPLNSKYEVVNYTFSAGNPQLPSLSTHMTQTLKGFEELFRDKIITIQWADAGSYSGSAGYRNIAYLTLLDNILSGTNLVRKAERWPLYVTLFSVLLCGVIARSLRGLYAVPLMLLVGAGLFLGAVWLMQNQQILIDVSYPVAAIILSIAAFPLARFAWTMRAEVPSAPPSFIPEPIPVSAPLSASATGAGWFAVSSGRLSLSLPLAALVLLTAIGSGVLATSLLRKPEILQEPVYIMSLPTVEVQDYYSPGNGSAQ